jgi:Uma2 family endonuclease
MSPAGIPHNNFLIQIVRLFAPLLSKFDLAVQGTLTVSEGQVYDPDFMLLRLRAGGDKDRLPRSDDVLLVIEASDSSLRRDQLVKLPVYASAGIAEYWIADLDRETLIVHRDLNAGKYRVIETLSGDDVITPLASPDFSFPVRQLFD